MARGRRAWRPISLVLALGACGLQSPQSTTPSATPAPGATTLPPAGYQLVWSDEFNGNALDTSKWTAETGPRRDYIMTPDSAQVANSILTITTYTVGGVHHSAFLTTEGHFQVAMGYLEARIKFQDAPGEWCSFWLFSPTNGDPLGNPAQAGVEIDMVEHRVTDQGGWTALKDLSAMNLNWDGYGANMQNRQKIAGLPDGGALQGAWRTYGVLWTASSYTFYIDGFEVWTSTDAVSHIPEMIQLTCEVADATWAGNIPPGGYGPRSTSTTGMQVDWVRVWQPAP
jgi:beta-glucanase (GH16 family)